MQNIQFKVFSSLLAVKLSEFVSSCVFEVLDLFCDGSVAQAISPRWGDGSYRRAVTTSLWR